EMDKSVAQVVGRAAKHALALSRVPFVAPTDLIDDVRSIADQPDLAGATNRAKPSKAPRKLSDQAQRSVLFGRWYCQCSLTRDERGRAKLTLPILTPSLRSKDLPFGMMILRDTTQSSPSSPRWPSIT